MIEEDLDLFTKGEFGIAALINGVEVWGLLDEYHDPLSLSDTFTEGRKFCFRVSSSEISGIEHGFPLEIVSSSRLFEVVGVQPQSDGSLTNLILKEL